MTKSDLAWAVVVLIASVVSSCTSYSDGYKAGMQHAAEMTNQ